MNWNEHITTDPKICHGQPCMKGTRILVTVVLDNLAADHTFESILESYPTLTRDAIKAALAYAAYLAREEVIYLNAQH